MQPLKANSHWKMKVMRVEVRISMYSLPSDVSNDENIFFDPATPCSTSTSHSHHKPGWHQLTLSTSDDEDISTVDIPSPSSMVTLQNPVDFPQQPPSKCTLIICDDLHDKKEEEDFQTVSLDDYHWTMEEIPDWTFVYTWTFSTTWTVPIPMPIFWIIHLHHTMTLGSQWHFWIWRFDDYIQWWRHSFPRRGHWILKPMDYG